MMIPLNSVNTKNMGFHDVGLFIPVTNNRLVSDVAVRMERMGFHTRFNVYKTVHAGSFLYAFVVVCCCFLNLPFQKNLSEKQSECQAVWFMIRPDVLVGPDLGPNCLQMLTADY